MHYILVTNINSDAVFNRLNWTNNQLAQRVKTRVDICYYVRVALN